ncbi:peptidase Do [compost metagenome]
MSTSLQGVVVMQVNRGSPAARIGLEPKDIVRSVNGTAIDTSKTLEHVMADDASFWRVEIERDGQLIRQFFR